MTNFLFFGVFQMILHKKSKISLILIRGFMTLRQLTEHNLQFLRLKRGCTGSPESIHIKFHIVGNHMSRLKHANHNI